MGFKLAIFSLNQWALDFVGNTKRILKSIDQANEAKAAYRAGPELEICGYSVEDALFEQDTVYHSWCALLDIIKHSSKMNMIVDVGMPVHYSSLYNCRVITYKGKILCIRAKTSLAKDGNYREFRHFTPWPQGAGLSAYELPPFVARALDQEFVPFGADFILEVALNGFQNTLRIGWEICQELWDVSNVSSTMYDHFGCHLVINSSGSYWELRKLNIVLDMVRGISLRAAACYAFSNFIGCDGQRYVFYGRSCIFDNGRMVSITPTNSGICDEIQMITHIIDPKSIDEHRAQQEVHRTRLVGQDSVWDLMKPPKNPSQMSNAFTRLRLMAELNNSPDGAITTPMRDISLRFELEIHLYVSLWLWDYLRRSRMSGFMMPLSGGLDSSTVATLVYSMCCQVYPNLGNPAVQEYFQDAHNIAPENLSTEVTSPESICKRILRCSYLSTRYSSQETRDRAKNLSEAIGAEFIELSIGDIYNKFRDTLTPGKPVDDVSLLDQNLQARLRMTATYYLSGGNRIVLATGNVDEAIMGYLTKYDCSSADINPIGGLCKDDLKNYLRFCCEDMFTQKQLLVATLREIIAAPPSAELTGAEQRDEDEIGVTYDEISILGRVRRGIYGCRGPLGAFELVWRNRHNPPFCEKIRCLRTPTDEATLGERACELANLIKLFYNRYARNRHKLTVLTPSLHAETYSPDDNRFDHRHFLYAPWTKQFESIDTMVAEIKEIGDLI